MMVHRLFSYLTEPKTPSHNSHRMYRAVHAAQIHPEWWWSSRTTHLDPLSSFCGLVLSPRLFRCDPEILGYDSEILVCDYEIPGYHSEILGCDPEIPDCADLMARHHPKSPIVDITYGSRV